MRGNAAAKVLDDNAQARARDHVIRHVQPRIVGNSNGLTKGPEDVVYLVSRDAAVSILGTAQPIGINPDGELANVLDDIVLNHRVRISRFRAVDTKLSVNVRAIEDNARSKSRIIAVNCEAFEGDATRREFDHNRSGEAWVEWVTGRRDNHGLRHAHTRIWVDTNVRADHG